jgi:hypothetical protein
MWAVSGKLGSIQTGMDAFPRAEVFLPANELVLPQVRTCMIML